MERYFVLGYKVSELLLVLVRVEMGVGVQVSVRILILILNYECLILHILNIIVTISEDINTNH